MQGLLPKPRSETHAVVERRTGRRQKRRQEFDAQTRLAELLPKYLDPKTTFFSSLENRAITRLSGRLHKRRGCRSGLPDAMIVHLGRVVFVELKSRRGALSKVQRQIRVELLQAGAAWFLARTPRAALAALALAGVPFKRPWKAPPLQPWEGPTMAERLPPSPELVIQSRQAVRRWRERHRALKEAAREGAGPSIGSRRSQADGPT
jgi:hypothetical protein